MRYFISKFYIYFVKRVLKPAINYCNNLLAWFLRRYLVHLPYLDTPPEQNQVRQILVFIRMGIGNFILFFPTLRNIRAYYPKAKIVLLCVNRGISGSDLLPPGLVDQVFEFEKSDSQIFSGFRLWWFVKRHLLKPDVVFVRWTNDYLIPLILAITRPRWRVGHVSGADFVGKYDMLYNFQSKVIKGCHEVDLGLDLARVIGIPIDGHHLSIHIPETSLKRARSFLGQVINNDQPFVTIQVSTSNIQPWKRLSLDRWSLIIQALLKVGYPVVLLGAKEEQSLLDTLCLYDDHLEETTCINAAGHLSLSESAAVVTQSSLFLSADTSLMHVAAATGTPQIVFWGPTEFNRTRPLSQKCIFLKKPCHCSGSLFAKEVIQGISACTQSCLEINVEEALRIIMPLLPQIEHAQTKSISVEIPFEKTSGCPLCSEESSQLLFKFDFSKWRQNGNTWLRRCVRCGLLFNWPRPSLKELSAFYGPDYYVFKRNDAETFQRMIPIHARTVRIVEGMIRSKKVLDIGCAGGHFPAMLKSQGWDARGVEISEKAAEYARQRWKIPVFTGTIEQYSAIGERFPLVTAIDVLEHVPDPHVFIQAVSRTCEQGGYLVLDTPNAGAFHARVLGATWRGFNPFHIQLFSKDNIRGLLKKYGFEILKSFSYNNIYPKVMAPGIKIGDNNDNSILQRVAKITARFPLYPHSKDAQGTLAKNCQGENLVIIARYQGAE